MKWYNEEKIELIKAWEACTDLKKSADSSIALSPNANYMVLTTTGVIGRGLPKS